METIIGKHWHHMPEAEILDLLNTTLENGLDKFEIEHRQKHFGLNYLSEKKARNAFQRFLLQFNQPLIYILLSAVLITLLLKEWVDAGVILAVVLTNAIIGFTQESKALKAIKALSGILNTKTSVLRGGKKQLIDAGNLVPGDIVFLQSGDRVPADVRLLDVRELQIDESALTGESLPIQKKKGILEHDVILADRTNMAYASTLVTFGQGKGVVVSIGDKTEVGKISQLISETEELETPLTRKIAYFSHILLYAIIALAALTFGIGIIRGESLVEMFMAAVALAVGAIPEGLPAAVTITLAIGVSRMAKRRALIRKLPAVETLGSTTIICSDKTGTLTENQMTVVEMYADGNYYSLDGNGYNPEGTIKNNNKEIDINDHLLLKELLISGILCNDSNLVNEKENWKIEGDPTEGALIVAALKASLNEPEIKEKYTRLDSIPFESQHQYMATLNDLPNHDYNYVYVKGAVEAILEKTEFLADKENTKNKFNKSEIMKIAEQLSGRGLRVLAFARKKIKKGIDKIDHSDIKDELEFIGLQAMIDPPRKEAIAAIKTCHAAGITVKMITGDHVLTAQEIGVQIGLQHPPNNSGFKKAYSGKEIAEMSDEDFIATANNANIFARVTPEQKLRLVEALQSRSHVVAMTGDGVNDAPALKRADIGIAMGINGTEVAKESADMVLTDDNFESIEAAVEEGRSVFDNLTKFIVWTLPTNLGEGLVILAAILAGVILPILPLQILWINMTTAVLLGLTLAFEPKEPGIMFRPPRDPEIPILTTALIRRIILVGGLMLAGAFGIFNWELNRGTTIEEARTAAINVFIFIEIFYLFNSRSLSSSVFKIGFFSNPVLFGGVSIMIVLQLFFTYLPLMNTLFQSAAISLEVWIRVLLISVAASLIVAIEKWLTKKSSSIRDTKKQ
ncbi:MAG: cation-transporting P-type ATPase [Calditrichaceae bacterium]|nr:cation-transporting P-type ATPase [Calditrichaceae bacterium]MBN2708600.1 cation-transporting P-type ATPase [Calditrichaceae bacterium]RQV95451.1 MAG: cation-transporting P-type ATPase [Calditrichota bacterium]